jgi:hypothetical protein
MLVWIKQPAVMTVPDGRNIYLRMGVVYGQECADISTIQDCSVHWEVKPPDLWDVKCMVHLGFKPNERTMISE